MGGGELGCSCGGDEGCSSGREVECSWGGGGGDEEWSYGERRGVAVREMCSCGGGRRRGVAVGR